MTAVTGPTASRQLYFPDQLNDHVLSQAPHAERPGRDTTNADDEIFTTGGEPAIVDVAADGDGYRAAICLVLPAVDEAP